MATQLSEGLWHVDCRTRDRPNVYIVDDGVRTLVDAGWPGDEETVRDGLDEAGFEPEDIDQVLLTHYDADHVGTLARLTPSLDAPVFVHRDDAPYVAGNRLPPWTARNGLETFHRLYYRRLTLPNLPIRRIGDGDEIGSFRAYHTPGHTPGHVAYVHEGLDAAFIGDLAFEVGGRLRPSGRVTSYDPRSVEESIRTLLDRTRRFDYVCPGHGRPLEDGRAHLLRTVE
ncbi:MBL fold metallo-hydrolase [Haladaptatus salinisoli]|uniref:MBL fold metallo-hydrolase n=1 Tax=Haladaptatus salinisoli TaxID=2884876 RepID=UPI001D0A8CE6|nr:MBL fold metallo-hydrolase [Haladaptatus salinisoli]